MEEEEKYRIIRHQMWNERRHARKILRHTDDHHCAVVGCLDPDLNPLHLMTGNLLFAHAHWFVPYPYSLGSIFPYILSYHLSANNLTVQKLVSP